MHLVGQQAEVHNWALSTASLGFQVEIETPHFVPLLFQPGGQRAQTERRRNFASDIERRMSEKYPHRISQAPCQAR